jgi:hypothetical protein
MKLRLIFLGFLLFVAGGKLFSQNSKENIRTSRATIQKFKEKDPGINKFFRNAYGYVVFPHIGKGGLMYEAPVSGQKFKVIFY